MEYAETQIIHRRRYRLRPHPLTFVDFLIMYIISSQRQDWDTVEQSSASSWQAITDLWMYEDDDGQLQWLSTIKAIGFIDKNGVFSPLDMDELIEEENRDARYERSNVSDLRSYAGRL